jgi:hypothetical protein
MSKRVGNPRYGAAHVFSVCATGCLMLFTLLLGNNNVVRQVGGIKVDAKGVVSLTPVEMRNDIAEQLRKSVKPANDQIKAETEMRMVSLKSLNQAIKTAMETGHDQLPDEIRFLAGIQRVEYVFLYPEENDIVLAGPGEGWVVDEQGNVVGETTGYPVVQLEDLLVAMQTVNRAREGFGISCSIDPTDEGRHKFSSFVSKQRGFSADTIRGAEEAMGMQQISLTGVPTDSRYAHVMVAADYRMKRIAMHLEETPVKEIPSFLTLLKQKNSSPHNLMPRWWLATNYEPLSRSADGLAWKLNGPGVKAMTEDEAIGVDGEVAGTGKVNPIAQTWADNMTKHYDALMVAEPIFGDLRNIMDLSVVAALIEKEQMLSKVNLKIPMITSDESATLLVKYNTPQSVPTQCSFMKVKRGTLLTASGGVQIDSWEVAEKTKEDQTVSVKREKGKPYGTTAWYWN